MMCRKKDQGENGKTYEEQLPRKDADQSRHRCDALAAPELHIEREAVSQDCTRACIETAQDRRDLSSNEKLRCKEKGQNTLCNISDKYDQSRLRPEIPERIGRSRISRSDLSDVNTFRLAIYKRCLKQPETVPEQQAQHSSQHDFSSLPQSGLSFSLLSLMIKRSEVPRKSKVSRILFSI